MSNVKDDAGAGAPVPTNDQPGQGVLDWLNDAPEWLRPYVERIARAIPNAKVDRGTIEDFGEGVAHMCEVAADPAWDVFPFAVRRRQYEDPEQLAAPLETVRDIRERVQVTLNPPPCERTFRLTFRPNGDLRAVQIDDEYYACVKRKHQVLLLDGDRLVTLVDVLVRLG